MGIKRIASISFLNQFIASALAVLVPLLLLQRGISIVEIGLILSALPFIFLFARMIFAAIADQSGFRPFFVIDWLTQVASIVIYIFAGTPFWFLAGKVTEGLRASAFWAVNRTAIFYYARGKEAKMAVRLSAVRTAGSAIGTALAGAIAAVFGLHYALLALLAASLFQGFPAVSLKPYKKGFVSIAKTFSLLLPFGKGGAFWFAAIALGLYAIATYPIFYLVAPIFMRVERGLGYDTIGYVIAGYFLLNTLSTWAGARFGIQFRSLALAQALIFGTGCAFIALMGSSLFIPFFLLLAVADGLSLVMFEAVIAKATKGKPSVSTDIGFLHVPFRIAEFVSIIFAGFAFQYLGYPVVFSVSALAFAAYSYMGWRLLK